MTSGAVNVSQGYFHEGTYFVGTTSSRDWTGGDTPKAERREPAMMQTVVRDGVRYRWTKRTPDRPSPPPRKKENEYQSAWTYTSSSMFRFPQTGSAPWYPPYGAYPYIDLVWRSFAESGPPGGVWIDLLDGNTSIKLVTKLQEQMRGTDFNMAVFLGEGHQTLALIADTAKRIAAALYHLRTGRLHLAVGALIEGTARGNARKVRINRKGDKIYVDPAQLYSRQRPAAGQSESQFMATEWLKLQYGWLPLLQDAYGAAQSLAHHLSSPFTQSYRVRCRKEESGTATRVVTELYTASTPWTRSHGRSIIARVTENSDSSIAAKLGLLDPEIVAWELVPFSFVVDWFIPIGSYLQARAFSSRLTGTFVTSELWKGSRSSRGSPGWIVSGRNTRIIATTLDVQLPSIKPLHKIASWMHCVNALALLGAR